MEHVLLMAGQHQKVVTLMEQKSSEIVDGSDEDEDGEETSGEIEDSEEDNKERLSSESARSSEPEDEDENEDEDEDKEDDEHMNLQRLEPSKSRLQPAALSEMEEDLSQAEDEARPWALSEEGPPVSRSRHGLDALNEEAASGWEEAEVKQRPSSESEFSESQNKPWEAISKKRFPRLNELEAMAHEEDEVRQGPSAEDENEDESDDDAEDPDMLLKQGPIGPGPAGPIEPILKGKGKAKVKVKGDSIIKGKGKTKVKAKGKREIAGPKPPGPGPRPKLAAAPAAGPTSDELAAAPAAGTPVPPAKASPGDAVTTESPPETTAMGTTVASTAPPKRGSAPPTSGGSKDVKDELDPVQEPLVDPGIGEEGQVAGDLDVKRDRKAVRTVIGNNEAAGQAKVESLAKSTTTSQEPSSETSDPINSTTPKSGAAKGAVGKIDLLSCASAALLVLPLLHV